MAPRPTWNGYLRLSLVSCPVSMFTAVSRAADVRFNMLHEATGNRIRMVPTDPETGPVDRAEIVKGYEIEDGQYVVVTDEEIAAVRLETTQTLNIERFVDSAEIDRLYWDDPYFLAPDGEVAAEAFGVIRHAMEKSDRIALGRLVMHQRERLMAIEPRGRGLLAYSLRSRDEVRDPDEIFADIPKTRPDPQMVEIAGEIIARQDGPFDPETFTDRYEDALRKLIADKRKGRDIVAPEPPRPSVAGDLMEALRRSLGSPAPTRRKAAATAKAPARRKPARRKRTG
jgi:DNA end-binding protein Ku